MSNQLAPIASGGFSDLVASLGYSAAGLAGTGLGLAIDKLLNKRAEQAREILFDEIAKGERPPRSVAEQDEFVAIFYRYMRVSQEGAARQNLRYLAKVISGQILTKAVYASDFLRYADLIASLARHEIAILGVFERQFADARLKCEDEVGSMREANAEARKRLVPAVFSADDEYQASLIALQRTGLLWPKAPLVDGGAHYATTPLMQKLSSLASFEEAHLAGLD